MRTPPDSFGKMTRTFVQSYYTGRLNGSGSPPIHVHRDDVMGLFKDLLAKDEGNKPRVERPKLSPQYERINRWIETRVGKFDPSDPQAKPKLDGLLAEESKRYRSDRGRIYLQRSGNDTIITGDTIHYKGRLKSLGCKWDGKRRCWVAKDRVLTEQELDDPSQILGLKAYINTIPYRTKLS